MEEIKVKRLFNIYGLDKGTGFAGNVFSKNGLSPTLTTCEGGNRQPFVLGEPIAYDEQNGYLRTDGTVGT